MKIKPLTEKKPSKPNRIFSLSLVVSGIKLTAVVVSLVWIYFMGEIESVQQKTGRQLLFGNR